MTLLTHTITVNIVKGLPLAELESKIQKRVVKWLESIGCKTIKLVVANKSGNADLIICYKGFYIEFEMKKPLEEPTKLQVIKGNLTIDADGAWFAIHSLEEAQEAITEVIQRRGLEPFSYIDE